MPSQISLEKLGDGRLPDRVLSAIAEMQVTLSELAEWDSAQPSFRINLTRRELAVDIRFRMKLRRLIPILGTLLTIIVTLLKVYGAYLS